MKKRNSRKAALARPRPRSRKKPTTARKRTPARVDLTPIAERAKRLARPAEPEELVHHLAHIPEPVGTDVNAQEPIGAEVTATPATIVDPKLASAPIGAGLTADEAAHAVERSVFDLKPLAELHEPWRAAWWPHVDRRPPATAEEEMDHIKRWARATRALPDRPPIDEGPRHRELGEVARSYAGMFAFLGTIGIVAYVALHGGFWIARFLEGAAR